MDYFPHVYPYDHNTVTAVDETDPSMPTITKNTESNGTWITGLIDGDVYQATVTTTSKAGTSAPSKPVTLRTVPAPANDQHVVRQGPGKARIAYSPQRYAGAPVQRYTLTATDQTDSNAEPITVHTRSNAPTLTGLATRHTYKFTETTTSTAGISAPSKPLTFTASSYASSN